MFDDDSVKFSWLFASALPASILCPRCCTNEHSWHVEFFEVKKGMWNQCWKFSFVSTLQNTTSKIWMQWACADILKKKSSSTPQIDEFKQNVRTLPWGLIVNKKNAFFSQNITCNIWQQFTCSIETAPLLSLAEPRTEGSLAQPNTANAICAQWWGRFFIQKVFWLGVAVAQRTFFLQHLTLAFAHMQNSDLVIYVLSFFNASTSRYSSKFYQFHETNGQSRHGKEKVLNWNDSVKEKQMKRK